MKTLVSNISAFLADEEGLTTVEYAVAGTLIALVVVGAFSLLGQTVNTNIRAIESNLNPPAAS